MRRILEEVQAAGEGDPKQYGDPLEAYHVALMLDAGLVEGIAEDDENGRPYVGIPTRLTWAGEDFLAAARQPKLWSLAKDYVLKPGATWSLGLLLEYWKAEILKSLGV